MSNEKIKDVAHSVKERLKTIAKKRGREHQDLILSYLIERFLYRVSVSKHAEQFILKGALMLQVLGEQCTRATRDIDLMSQSELSLDKCRAIITEIINCVVPDDGVIFDSETVEAKQIQNDSRERGVRAVFIGKIDMARATLQLDIGPYCRVIPGPLTFDFPQLLNFGCPSLLGYSAESIIADKFEAMVSRDETNTRLKDFYDIWILSNVRYFEMSYLKEAIETTFDYYETPIPKDIPICFREEFYLNRSKLSQWNAFLRNAKIHITPEFYDINKKIQVFLMPVCDAINEKNNNNLYWDPIHGWIAKSHP